MFFTPEKAVRNITLMLPYTTETFLDRQRIGHFTYLLKFIYTHHDMNAL